MALESSFHSDAALTTPIVSLASKQLEDDSSSPAYPNPADRVAYFGLANAAKKVEALSNPGVDQIQINIVSNVVGWSAGATIALSDIVQPSTPNGYKYQAQGAGTTHATVEPTWPTVIGETVDDNGITWECIDEIHAASEFRLATSQAGLDAATPGAAINVGTTINGGTGVSVWMRIDQGVHPAGDPYADVRLETNDLVESVI
ncbi:MAG: hypothetical protein KZQ93_15770 [Candidatus Thiodiazotropha sp. (ex Monitilora ramsayi)]|nr:hypothetical protein [Candidatus Thiodiazotropha sp. (ex Monitilora ramsayi)]